MTIIRAEHQTDVSAIESVNICAFGRDNEAKLVNLIRASAHFTPELSLVAEEDGRVIGHILFSGAAIEHDGTTKTAIVLAPMAVVPERQGQGVGSQLVRAGLDACKKMGYPIVIVLGHPGFYPKFGFVPAKEKGIAPPFPVPDDVFMVCELVEGAARQFFGTVQYPPAFSVV